MGMPPPFATNTVAAAAIKPGLYAQAWAPSRYADDPVRGDHLWFRVDSVDRDDGTWTGTVVTAPVSRCGFGLGDTVDLLIDEVEQVSVSLP